MAKKGFWHEFKEFISRGNVMDLAVGVVIGGAFQSIIKSLVDDVIMPFIGLITGGTDFSEWKLVLGSGAKPATLHYGNVIAAIINFLLIAFVIFLVVRLLAALKARTSKPQSAAVTTKQCPYCLSEIPRAATRCPHCTSKLPGYEEEQTAESRKR